MRWVPRYVKHKWNNRPSGKASEPSISYDNSSICALNLSQMIDNPRLAGGGDMGQEKPFKVPLLTAEFKVQIHTALAENTNVKLHSTALRFGGTSNKHLCQNNLPHSESV